MVFTTAATDAAAWLLAFQSAVASRDLEAGRHLFAEDVQAYGTRSAAMSGLDALVTRQWQPIWTATSAFRFTGVDYEASVGSTCVVAAQWESFSASGQRRQGRSTLVLSGRPLRCVHSHFSMLPLDGGRLE